MKIYTYNTATGYIMAISSRTSLRNARRLADQSNAWYAARERTFVDVVLPA